MFKILKTKGLARLGKLKTRRGIINTPVFMPIATKGAIKTLSVEEIKKLSPDIILGNTYHLMLRPGKDDLEKFGGLHEFMKWSGPILTDSGGFQVFSLAKMRKIKEDGVNFSSHIDGKKFFLTPEGSINIQIAIDSDIMMVLDECVELPAEKRYLEKSIELTARWARRCHDYYFSKVNKKNKNRALLFGIAQGGTDKKLRQKSVKDLTKIDFDGLAIGGLAVGESEQDMYSVLSYSSKIMPFDKPRYLMGVGYPNQIVQAVKSGIDMFDCVIPTREARHGRIYRWNKKIDFSTSFKKKNDKSFYLVTNIKKEEHKYNNEPINGDSIFPELKIYSMAYLRHLFVTQEPLAGRLCTLNNLEFYLKMMEEIRKVIRS